MDVKGLLDQMLGGASTGAAATGDGTAGVPFGLKGLGGVAGGLAAGGLMGLLLGNKKARKTVGKMAGGIVGLGGAAALGAIAYGAYRNWQGQRASRIGFNGALSATVSPEPALGGAGAEPASIEDFDLGRAAAADGKPFELAVVKAMIAAANADRHIDADEQRAVFDSVSQMALDAECKATVFDTLTNPPGVDEIAALARRPEQAAELYLASRLAIDVDHPMERKYLDDLADRLWLPPDLVAELDRQLDIRDRSAA